MIANFFGGVVFLVLSAAVFVMDLEFVGVLVRDRAASEHPTASAIITRSEVESKNNNEQAGEYAVAYSYQVNGREYVGDKFHHGMHAGGLKAARAIQAHYPVGSHVNIHYNPTNPSESVMTTGLRGDDLLGLMLITPFNVALVAGWWVLTMTTGAAREREFRMGFQAPVIRLPGENGEVRLRLAHARPLAVFLRSLAGASFGMGFFVMMVLFGADVSVTQMGVAWASVLGFAVGLTGWQTKRIATGRYDFRVDRLRGTLALPPGFERKTDTSRCSTDLTGEVALVRIVDIRVASREETDSEGNRIVYYEPVIHLDGVAENATLAVTTQTTEEYAKEIVQELRREVGLTAQVEFCSAADRTSRVCPSGY